MQARKDDIAAPLRQLQHSLFARQQREPFRRALQTPAHDYLLICV